jgi:hypothetical protein
MNKKEEIESAVENAYGHLIDIMRDFDDIDDRDLFFDLLRKRIAPFEEPISESNYHRKIETGRIEL